tara:strand:+ start:23890 stop:24231 length:342 start_codon:yes stop_codon:yes gene_type:complete
MKTTISMFNTGRSYTHFGQRVFYACAIEASTGRRVWHFYDFDRMVEGFFYTSGNLGSWKMPPETERRIVLSRYDNGSYELSYHGLAKPLQAMGQILQQRLRDHVRDYRVEATK